MIRLQFRWKLCHKSERREPEIQKEKLDAGIHWLLQCAMTGWWRSSKTDLTTSRMDTSISPNTDLTTWYISPLVISSSLVHFTHDTYQHCAFLNFATRSVKRGKECFHSFEQLWGRRMIYGGMTHDDPTYAAEWHTMNMRMTQDDPTYDTWWMRPFINLQLALRLCLKSKHD